MLKYQQIESVTFMSGKVHYLPLNMFKLLRNVKDLNIYDSVNGMAAPKNGHFSSAWKLERIIIQNQRLGDLQPRVFEGATIATVIRLDNNLITSLDEDTFGKITNVKHLSISHNDIRALPEKLFVTLRGLEVLDLGSNMIYSLPETIFAANRNLKHIRLSHNRIVMIPSWKMPENTFFDFADNFCIDKIFTLTSQLNEATHSKCVIDKKPSDMIAEIENACKDQHSLSTVQPQQTEAIEKKNRLLLENQGLRKEITKIKIYKNSLC